MTAGRIMLRRILCWAIVSTACATSAVLGAVPPGDYPACDLQHLDVCKNSNQLFSNEKFERTLRGFMEKAPSLARFGAAGPAAVAAMMGPDGPPVALSNGKLFFRGFTPHDATQRGAAVFNPDRTILFFALLTGSGELLSGERILIIYAHDRAPGPDMLAPIRAWAEQYTANMYTPPGLPKYFLSAPELYVRSDVTGLWH